MVSGKVELDLALLELRLLDGEDVGADALDDVNEARILLHDGAQAVDVPVMGSSLSVTLGDGAKLSPSASP